MKFIILLGRDRMSEYESSIIKKIDSKYVVDKTVELANIDSPTGKEKEVALKYKEILEEVGMKVYLQEVENDRYNVIGVLRGEEPGYCSLMFNGHMDTSFSFNDPWEILSRISPYYRREQPQARVEGDYIYGLGVYNMKSALAAYATAVKAIVDSGIKLKGTLMVAGVVGEIEKAQIDEFQGSSYRGYGYGTSYLVQHGGTADYAIIGEPTGLRLVTEHFGSLWTKISISTNKLSHSAYSKIDDNLIVKLAKFINEFKDVFIPQYYAKYRYKGVDPVINIGAVEGGLKWRLSRTPINASIYIDLRYPPLSSIEEVKKDVLQFIFQMEKKLEVNIDVNFFVSDHWAYTDENSLVVKSIREAHKAVTNEEVKTTIVTWSSDANILTKYGVQTVLYGPAGDPDPKKEVRGVQYIPNLITATKVYALAAYKITSNKCH